MRQGTAPTIFPQLNTLPVAVHIRSMSAICKTIVEAKLFNNFILGVILLAGVVVGCQTYPELEEQYGNLLTGLDRFILGIFVVEIILKMCAQGSQPWNYFKDPWNVFDFVIVVACLIPTDSGNFAAVLRLARVLRVLRLVSAIPRLQILVGAVLRSVPSIGYVFLLALMLFYIYGCMATFLFMENDPLHFRNLQTSMLSLFRVVTLEDWTDIMYINMYGSDAYVGYEAYDNWIKQELDMERVSKAMPLGGAIFFVSFILTGSMIVLNLFIGVMLTGMDEARKEQELTELAQGSKDAELKDELKSLEQQLSSISKQLAMLGQKADSNASKLSKLSQGNIKDI